jgi:hypothetical protein
MPVLTTHLRHLAAASVSDESHLIGNSSYSTTCIKAKAHSEPAKKREVRQFLRAHSASGAG